MDTEGASGWSLMELESVGVSIRETLMLQRVCKVCARRTAPVLGSIRHSHVSASVRDLRSVSLGQRYWCGRVLEPGVQPRTRLSLGALTNSCIKHSRWFAPL